MKDEAKFMERVLELTRVLKFWDVVKINGPLYRWQNARTRKSVSSSIGTNIPVQLFQTVYVLWAKIKGKRVAVPFGKSGTPGASERFGDLFTAKSEQELLKLGVNGASAMFDNLMSQAMPSKLQLIASVVMRESLTKDEAVATILEHVGSKDADAKKFATGLVNVIWATGAFVLSQYALNKAEVTRTQSRGARESTTFSETCDRAFDYAMAQLAPDAKPAATTTEKRKAAGEGDKPHMVEHLARGGTIE